LRCHAPLDLFSSRAVAPLDTFDARLERCDDQDCCVTLLPEITLKKQRYDLHDDAVAGLTFQFFSASPNAWMHDCVEGFAFARIRKNDRCQSRAIDIPGVDNLRPSRRDLCKSRRAPLDDFARELIGIDDVGAELHEYPRDLALPRADSAGQTYAHH
jgi:hypothetical protein